MCQIWQISLSGKTQIGTNSFRIQLPINLAKYYQGSLSLVTSLIIKYCYILDFGHGKISRIVDIKISFHCFLNLENAYQFMLTFSFYW